MNDVPHGGYDSTPRGSDRIEGRRVFSALSRRTLVANAVGGAVAYIYLTLVAPPRPRPPEHELVVLLTIAPIYFGAFVLIARRLGRRAFQPVERWLSEARPATARERAVVLSLPWRTAAVVGSGWLIATLVFGLQAATHHPAVYVAGVAAGIALAGLATTGISFLVIEHALRPLFAVALAGESRAGTEVAGARALRTRPRLLISWALGSGVALIAIAVAFLGRGGDTGDQLIGPILFLVIAGLLAGGVLVAAAARSVAEPVDRVRAALERVEAGSLDEEVVVDHGGEIGFLQAGFNRMVAGLRERERIRQVFGTYVDREVAERILREGTDLAGEEVEVTIMFLDVRDFTGFAERAPAIKVVATINRLFERTVPIIHRNGGHVDKFVGDGLLAVFGAPRRQEDHADRALAAALETAAAVKEEFGDELAIGVGLNSGSVVAGNVGGAGRLEFSVMGDAVNVAARIEAATRQTGDAMLISERTKRLLKRAQIPFVERAGLTLKGKADPVAVYAPVAREATR